MSGRALLAVVLALVAAPAALAGAGPPRTGIVHDAGASGGGSDLVARGAALYAGNCSTCHGTAGLGVSPPRAGGAGDLPEGGPSLRGVGALAADFYLRTGYMPLQDPRAQPSRSRVLFTDGEIRAMVAYVATLGQGPPIPHPHPERGNLAVGQRLFTDNCAGCHQIVAEGGYVTDARVPPLEDATPRQIAQAVRIGPYVMPHFTQEQISRDDLNSLIAYVQYAKHPDDRGGWSIGHLGPWPEGGLSWLLAGPLLVALCMVIGRRLNA